MNERLYPFLKWTAIILTLVVVASSLRQCSGERQPGDMQYLEGNTLFEDAAYERALVKYESALSEAPNHVHALFGKAMALMQLERHDAALVAFDEVLARQPDFAAAFANRGILHDRAGEYEKAITDYERALELDPELAEGPNWLTRFLRNQPDKPPAIDDRATYLKRELTKPESERVLRVPEVDAEQRPYKQ